MPNDSERNQSPLILKSRVPSNVRNQPLLDYLVARFPYHDRDHWAAEVRAGRLQVDARTAKVHDQVGAGTELAYTRNHQEPFVDDRIGVLHDDEALVVVDKPAHLPMHADGPFVRSTLIHLLRERLAAPDLSLVHRLDRETSGVCVLARTDPARTSLHAQFEQSRVQKSYLAVVRGRAEHDFVVDTPIGRARDSRITLRRAAGERADAPRPARTRFAVLAHGPNATLLRCEPETGRTHQIRVHLESVGLPVLGDKLYGRPDDDYLAFVKAVKASGDVRTIVTTEPDRQLLHAHSLGLLHPVSGAATTFTAPTPACFAQWLQRET